MTTPPNFAVHGCLAFVDNQIYTILQGDPDVFPPVLPKAELLDPLSFLNWPGVTLQSVLSRWSDLEFHSCQFSLASLTWSFTPVSSLWLV